MKKITILLLFQCHLLHAQLIIDSLKYEPISKYEIVDSLERINLLIKLRFYDIEKGYSNYNSEYLRLFDVSPKNDKSRIAIFGCFCDGEFCCTEGSQIAICKLKKNSFEYFKNTINGYEDVRYIKRVCNKSEEFKTIVAHTIYDYERIDYGNSEVKNSVICFDKHPQIPIDIMNYIEENLLEPKEKRTFSPVTVHSKIKIIKIKKKWRKSYWNIIYNDNKLKFICDKDCFHCQIKK
jgi:hypothetical protein